MIAKASTDMMSSIGMRMLTRRTMSWIMGDATYLSPSQGEIERGRPTESLVPG
jgi:hypothetical protein